MTGRPSWDPGTYLQFGDERQRPFDELIRRVPTPSPRHVVDLGCGPGTATATLLERWPGASVLGIDSSSAMIEQAQRIAVPPRLVFALEDVRDWRPRRGAVDVIVANASLHWVPGHLELFGGWVDALPPGGALAFQVPDNFDAPSHALLRRLAASSRWRAELAGAGDDVAVHRAPEYVGRLGSLGCDVDAWETTYYHRLRGDDPVLAWMQGTALRPYLARLDGDRACELLEAYTTELREPYPPDASGETLFPFKRVFVVATRR